MRNGKVVLGGVLIGLFVVTGLLTGGFESLKGLGTLVAAWATFAILSFLYKDNPLYKLAEHVMVGLAMGYFTIYYLFQILERQWWNRFVLGELRETELLFGSQWLFRFGLIIPAVGGVLMLTRVIPKIAWLSRWSMALLIGLGSGLAIPWTIQGNITTQLLVGSKLPQYYVSALYDRAAFVGEEGYGFLSVPLWEIGVPILILGTVCGLVYFFFSIPHRGAIGFMASAGIWILMIGFGASFGLTVMARLSLFIGRIIFLLKNWLELPWLVS